MEQTSEATPALMKIGDFCRLAQIGRTTLYELMRSGRIQRVKIGSRGVRIPTTELDRLIREATEGRN